MSAQPSQFVSRAESDPSAPLPMFTINVLVDGFPVKIEATGKADQLFAMVERLKTSGALPPAWATATTAHTADAPHVPICPKHNKPMKESRKPGKFYCPKKDGDGYCNEQA